MRLRDGPAAAATFARPAPMSRRLASRSSRAVSDASGRNTWTTMLSSTGVSVAFEGMSPGRLPRRLRLSLLRVAQSAPRRRWFLAEHFYSSIDRPWFVTRLGYGPFLEHLGLADAGPFSKKDRTTIRRALGKPRRLSLPFLRQERVRLERWRRSVRAEWETMIVHASTTANAKLGPPAAARAGREERSAERLRRRRQVGAFDASRGSRVRGDDSCAPSRRRSRRREAPSLPERQHRIHSHLARWTMSRTV